MEKRLLTALVLSTVVLVVWQFFAPKPPEPPRPPLPIEAPVDAARAIEAKEPKPVDDRPVLGEKVGEESERALTLVFGTPGTAGSYRATFSNRGARLTELKLANFYDQIGLDAAARADAAHWVTLLDSKLSGGSATGSLAWKSEPSSVDLEREPLERALWRMREIENGVEFDLAQGSGVRWIKRVRFNPGTYRVDVELAIENQTLDGARRLGYAFTPAEILPQDSADKFYVDPQAIAAGRTSEDLPRRAMLPIAQSVPRDDAGRERGNTFEVPFDELSFVGVHNHYFAVLLRGANDVTRASMTSARWRRMYDDAAGRANPETAQEQWKFVVTDVVIELDLPPKGETRSYPYALYAGPKDTQAMYAEHKDFEALVDGDIGSFCGLFSLAGLGAVLVGILRFFHGLVGNWGVAIILLTLAVRLVLYPVNRRSQTAMARFQKKMKRFQPELDAIKKRHEDDPAKMRKLQQELFAREGLTPPLGGCLPMFIQMPIFFGLYACLRTAFELRHAPFALWIEDLSKPDALLTISLDTHLPLIGVIEYFNLLPILMIVLWIWQQKLMPVPTDEQAAKMQKMMMWMPAIMGIFLYNYASGLSLYMIVQSGLGILEMTVVKKIWPIDDSLPPPGQEKKSWMQKMMARAEEAQRAAEASRGKGGKRK